MAPKPAADATQKRVPVERIGLVCCRANASASILISIRIAVAFLRDAGAPAPSTAQRAARARDDCRGGRRASVHALGGVAAAGDAGARGGGAAAGAGGA